eukprot:12416401-Ditylum_brightwellii.AAC.1
MNSTKKHNYLNEDQHGGRNSGAKIDIAIGKVYMFDKFHVQQSNFGCTDCNAKACYNRIIPLAYVKVGLPSVSRSH